MRVKNYPAYRFVKRSGVRSSAIENMYDPMLLSTLSRYALPGLLSGGASYLAKRMAMSPYELKQRSLMADLLSHLGAGVAGSSLHRYLADKGIFGGESVEDVKQKFLNKVQAKSKAPFAVLDPSTGTLHGLPSKLSGQLDYMPGALIGAGSGALGSALGDILQNRNIGLKHLLMSAGGGALGGLGGIYAQDKALEALSNQALSDPQLIPVLYKNYVVKPKNAPSAKPVAPAPAAPAGSASPAPAAPAGPASPTPAAPAGPASPAPAAPAGLVIGGATTQPEYEYLPEFDFGERVRSVDILHGRTGPGRSTASKQIAGAGTKSPGAAPATRLSRTGESFELPPPVNEETGSASPEYLPEFNFESPVRSVDILHGRTRPGRSTASKQTVGAGTKSPGAAPAAKPLKGEPPTVLPVDESEPAKSVNELSPFRSVVGLPPAKSVDELPSFQSVVRPSLVPSIDELAPAQFVVGSLPVHPIAEAVKKEVANKNLPPETTISGQAKNDSSGIGSSLQNRLILTPEEYDQLEQQLFLSGFKKPIWTPDDIRRSIAEHYASKKLILPDDFPMKTSGYIRNLRKNFTKSASSLVPSYNFYRKLVKKAAKFVFNNREYLNFVKKSGLFSGKMPKFNKTFKFPRFIVY